MAGGWRTSPTRLFVDRYVREPFRNTEYGVGADGRFLLTEVLGGETGSELRVFVGS